MVAGPVLAGCGAGGGAGRPLQLWHLFSGADGEKFLSMLDAARSRDPGLTVVDVCLEWGAAYYTKLAMATAGDEPPDLAVMHMSRLGGYAPSGLLQPFDPDLLARNGVSAATSTEALWSSATVDDHVYAIPLDTHPFVAFYNLDLAERAGLLGTDGRMPSIRSAEQFVEVNRKLAEVTGNIGCAFGFVNDKAQAWRLFWGLYNQTGGPYRFETGTAAEWDVDAAASVIAFVAGAMDDTVMSTTLDYDAGVSAFSAGRAGMTLSGEWEMPSFAEALPRLAGSPMPTMFGRAATYADSHAFVLPSRSDVDPERLARSQQLATELVKEGLTWAEGGHVPGYEPLTRTPAYRSMTLQSSYAAAAESVVLDPPLWFAGGGSDFQDRMSSRLIEGFVGRTDPLATSAAMLDDITAMLAVDNPL
ncbi:hypothetical protein AFB00_03400 [Pseudonocardia sp. HH130630-07]|nr:hypothetical protein AFB00_03400 [Pseudonocardia sp. HH130630-07]